ncbi:hypothetical protein DFP94_103239 [Fontibacillus phaseoli]|uniref:Uncharacterized protein n=1 Tax=Fontibacillus phaseoli TaxID=1416533 RepID=A0A369BIV1_9BACL|nr:hypothetical protein [Fontibacillus phaseoli]RCX20508.1 hypothetical protein DFP94_103239 [Fontibacillus phaseoli]
MNKKGSMPFAVKLLILLQGVLGAGAVFGGGVLVIDPSGEMIGMPTDMMKVPIFPDFLIPGLILLIVLGIGPLAIMVSLLRRKEWALGEKLNLFRPMHWSWTFSLYTAFALIIWIMVQLYIIKETSVIHVIYMTLGLVIQIVTLLPSSRDYYEPQQGRDEESGKGVTMT